MPDVFLYSVPSDANSADVRLRDPTTSAGGVTGVVANMAVSAALSAPGGTQTHIGVVAGATQSASLSTPAGTQIHVGVVSGATTATSTSSPTATQTHIGAVSNLSVASALSTPTGTTGGGGTITGTVANMTVAHSTSSIRAGRQGHIGGAFKRRHGSRAAELWAASRRRT